MDLFPLHIFPQGGLSGSIITTVWVGLFVMCYFNLRFGWVLSGLVVPGYLVPLLIVKPFAAFVIGLEAVVAYLIVWLFSEKLAPGRFPSFFGRDRFMGLILASIAVRLAFDGFLLPEFSTWLGENFDRWIDWEDNLQSFGLVIISLMANQFWKPGLKRGVFMAVVTIGITYLIVRFGLMEFTNFRISGVYYIYEGLASSILASPKAYIILVLTALLASHYNVKYGWDFSGILIPALIALQWYQPTKILTSFGEAIIIYCIARLILRLPIMANVTMEGGRKLLLFFNISFAWKMALGWFIVWQGFEVKTTDFFGFGYLLSTLIAIKAHDKDIFARVARSTLQVSLAGAVLGNFVGFAVSAATVRTGWGGSIAEEPVLQSRSQTVFQSLVVAAVGDAHVRAMRGAAAPLSAGSATALANLVELIDEGVPDYAAGFDQSANGWRLLQLADGRIAIVRDDGQGSELLVFDPDATGDEAIIVPDPTLRPGLAVAAIELQKNQDARWLVIGAPSPREQIDDRGVAEIHEDATDTAHIIVQAARPGATSRFLVSDNSAGSANISALRELIPDLKVKLAGEGRGARGSFAEISLNDAAIEAASDASWARPSRARLASCQLNRSRDQQRWSDLEQLAFVRFEIAAPLIARVRDGDIPHAARAAAQLGGMDVSRCLIDDDVHWHLSSPNRREGNIFLAEGEKPQKAVVSFENQRGALPAKIGAAVHVQWDSNALFIATRSDSFLRNPHTVFDVTWQEWVRSQQGAEDPMVFQLRARPREAIDYRKSVDVLVAADRIGQQPGDIDDLMSSLRRAGLRPEIMTNSRAQAGMESRPSMSVRYFDATNGRRYAFGWLMMPDLGEGSE